MNQDVFVKPLDFPWIVLQVMLVPVHAFDTLQHHPAMHAARKSPRFVAAEIDARVPLEQFGDPLDPFLVGIVRSLVAGCHRGQVRMTANADELLRDLFGPKYKVDDIRRDGGPWHTVVARGVRGLCDRDTARGTDIQQTGGSVRARAGEDDAHGTVAACARQRLEKCVHRQIALPIAHTFLQAQPVGLERHHGIRRYDVGVIRFRNSAVNGLFHGDRRRFLQQFGEHALVFRREVLDDHERESRRVGQGGEQFAVRFESARGCTEPHDRGPGIARHRGVVGSGFLCVGKIGHDKEGSSRLESAPRCAIAWDRWLGWRRTPRFATTKSHGFHGCLQSTPPVRCRLHRGSMIQL